MSQASFILQTERKPKIPYYQAHHAITDRGSKYSVTAFEINCVEDIKESLKVLTQNKHYRKATHNTYAARWMDQGAIVERKVDDGETGAGMTILRPMRGANLVNCMIVVTRWYGGVKLMGDRFKHVQDATKLAIHNV